MCFYCLNPGHLISDCKEWSKKNGTQRVKSVALTQPLPALREAEGFGYEPFILNGQVSVSNSQVMPIFCYQHFFFFFSHTTQHNIQNTTKQNNRHILNISRSNQKGGGEGRTTRTQKSLLYTITYVQQKTLPSINARRPGPTNSHRCTFT